MEEVAKLINRVLRHLGFLIPLYEAVALVGSSSAPNRVMWDFLIHMKLNDDIAYGALLLLHRFKDIPRNKSNTNQDGHKYFMAAYSLSAKALLDPDRGTFIRPHTHSFALDRSLFPWLDIEKARLSLVNDLGDTFTLTEVLPQFKSVVQRDFKSDIQESFSHYPRSLVTKHPQFLVAKGSRGNRVLDLQ